MVEAGPLDGAVWHDRTSVRSARSLVRLVLEKCVPILLMRSIAASRGLEDDREGVASDVVAMMNKGYTTPLEQMVVVREQEALSGSVR